MWSRKYLGTRTIAVRPSKVIGKQRPKFGNGRTYTPKQTEQAEAEILKAWRGKYGDAAAAFDGPVNVAISYQRELSKSNPLYWAGRSDLSVPDLDNVAKLVCDALNGVAWKDDRQIIHLDVTKMTREAHGGGNRIEIRVSYFREEHRKL